MREKTVWIYGRHAAMAALANPKRHCKRLLIMPSMIKEITRLKNIKDYPPIEVVDNVTLAIVTRQGVHQGIAVQVLPIQPLQMKEIIKRASTHECVIIIILDQVTDPHNIGAIMRSAAAFGALAVITSKYYTPTETSALAKAASGGLEVVLLVKTNINKAIKMLKLAGFWVTGLSITSSFSLQSMSFPGRVALVFGSEGHGLRHSTQIQCDNLVCLPTISVMKSLNVSNVVAITLYEIVRTRLDLGNII